MSSRYLISTSEAKAIIQNNVKTLEPLSLPLQQTVGLRLSADVFALNDIPPFPQSSMDGYAFSFDDWSSHQELIIEGEIAAGDTQALKIGPQKAIRIFTGAPVPPGADTVVMQEKIRKEGSKIVIEDQSLQQGTNVRPQGSEIRTGMLALPKGSLLSPAAIGFLAGIGTTTVYAIPKPSISIIVTGNELQEPGRPLAYGQVYESNSFALKAALQLLDIGDVKVQQVIDNREELTLALKEAIHSSDMVLLTGGVSVGDYDFVVQAAVDNGVTSLFHKIRQRPGKPLYFGKWKEKLVFGLPGNPSSVLTCFYMYVVAAIEQMCQRNPIMRSIQVPLSKTYRKAAGLVHFLKGYFDGRKVSPLDAQQSYLMHSFAQANCLIEIDEALTDCKEGAIVNIHLLPT